MKSRLPDYIYLLLTILFTVYGQVIVKWRVGFHGAFPSEMPERIKFLGGLFLDIGILSGLAAALVASMCWMVAMTKFQLSYAYPFMSLSFVAVLFLSAMFFKEPLSLAKVGGVALIVVGTYCASRG